MAEAKDEIKSVNFHLSRTAIMDGFACGGQFDPESGVLEVMLYSYKDNEFRQKNLPPLKKAVEQKGKEPIPIEKAEDESEPVVGDLETSIADQRKQETYKRSQETRNELASYKSQLKNLKIPDKDLSAKRYTLIKDIDELINIIDAFFKEINEGVFNNNNKKWFTVSVLKVYLGLKNRYDKIVGDNGAETVEVINEPTPPPTQGAAEHESVIAKKAAEKVSTFAEGLAEKLNAKVTPNVSQKEQKEVDAMVAEAEKVVHDFLAVSPKLEGDLTRINNALNKFKPHQESEVFNSIFSIQSYSDILSAKENVELLMVTEESEWNAECSEMYAEVKHRLSKIAKQHQKIEQIKNEYRKRKRK